MHFKKKVYIGETEELLARLGKHSASLKQNTHDCKELQEDWNQFGKEKFTFKVICFGDAYSSQIIRRQKETSVIKQKLAESFLLYNINKSTSFTRHYQRKIEIDGKIYSTITEAAKDPNLGISETTIRRRLRDANFVNYKDLKYSSFIYRIRNKLYKTLDEAKKDNVGGNRQTIKRRVDSMDPKWSEWQKLLDD
uniref:Putative GIY-YIG homing endonuclease n=1 Tax=Watanabea reniformis TaxID=191674 RepID=A0A097KKB1_9CHLO|nr:putative GIY-YIG homing endonuclease [Watanabea reniformis]AIT93630.1 putative GIY-YIG homing endonuclease [Watanabea reniformis]